MRRFFNIPPAGRGFRTWPALLLLCAATLIPTGSVLWFMQKAMENEHLAATAKLTDAYRGQLALMASRIQGFWTGLFRELPPDLASPPETFAKLVLNGAADSVLLFDETGRLLYPNASPPIPPPSPPPPSPAWRDALRSSALGRWDEAARIYSQLASEGPASPETGPAFQALLRALAQANPPSPSAIVDLALQAHQHPVWSHATDAHGRWILPNAELFALELLPDPGAPPFPILRERLIQRLTNYSRPNFPAAQRLFLMEALQTLGVPPSRFPSWQAESLAALYLEKSPQPERPRRLEPSPLPNVWQIASTQGQALFLFHTDTLLQLLHNLFPASASPFNPQLRLLPPGAPDISPISALAGELMPGWRLIVAENPADPLRSPARLRPKNNPYFWIAMLVITAFAASALLSAQFVRRQLRLTQLRNDLVATVSHELKTPLSSMRLLVDTLLEHPENLHQTARDYLRLIAKENARLSKLIDSFLLFSRLDRGKYQFHFKLVDPSDLLAQTRDAFLERFPTEEASLIVKSSTALPALRADPDALATALLNLLDNAHKYSQPPRRITLSASCAPPFLLFRVSDNGIGIAPAETRRIFKRFYQVDQRLSRIAGGCGLGLSIVQFIARAHQGSIQVQSQPGQGSAFTLSLPIHSPKPLASLPPNPPQPS